ncbi:hypothetical protein [Pseudomonas sp.]|uniref:hypothetical protein n=1 Tax=Pseudomonas sp. TaxID=306 RepID=UPI00258839B3|nr:hypothetical protein [Pseudomonas sp.]
MTALTITLATAEDEIESAIPFLDMRAHALAERETGNVLELHEFGEVVVLYSPSHHYAYVNERSHGVGYSLVIDAGDADSAEHAAQQWTDG